MECEIGEELATWIVALALRNGPASGDAVLRRIADADLDPPDLPDPGRLGRGRVRDRLRPGSLLALALELHGASDSRTTHPAHRQSRHRFVMRSDGSRVSMAHHRMAEFDPEADGARPGHERAPDQGMRGRGGDLRDPAGARAAVHADLPLHRRAFPPFHPATGRQCSRGWPRAPAVLVDRHQRGLRRRVAPPRLVVPAIRRPDRAYGAAADIADEGGQCRFAPALGRAGTGRARIHRLRAEGQRDQCRLRSKRDGADQGVRGPAFRRHAGSARQARARRAEARWSLRTINADRHHADRNGLGRSGGNGQRRVSASRRCRQRRDAVFLPVQSVGVARAAGLRRGIRARPVLAGLRSLALASAGRAAEALPARPEPRRHELREVNGAVRDLRRPDSWRLVERPAVRKHDLAQGHGGPQRRLSGVASAVPGWVVGPLHESERRIGSAGQRLGSDAHRLSAICERCDHFL